MATSSPSPTTTSDAATAMTAIANTCPDASPFRREKAISARLPPLSMISSERRTINGERRSKTPSAPIEKRIALTARYQATLGPSIELPRMVAEDHASDGPGEQHDRGHRQRQR